MVTSLTSLLGQEVPNAATYHYNYMPMSPLSSDSETNSSEIETSDSESDTGIFPGSLASTNETKNTAGAGTVGHGSVDGRLPHQPAERHSEPYDRDPKDNGNDAGYFADVESGEDSGAEDEDEGAPQNAPQYRPYRHVRGIPAPRPRPPPPPTRPCTRRMEGK